MVSYGEVKIFNADGSLQKVLSPKQLSKANWKRIKEAEEKQRFSCNTSKANRIRNI